MALGQVTETGPVLSMLAQHAAGISYREIGRQHGLHHEEVRRIVVGEGDRFITRVAMDVLVAERAERRGQEAQWPTFLIPYQAQEDWQGALSFVGWVLARLRALGDQVRLETKHTEGGTAFMIVPMEGPK